jgi:hypothetical protein
MVTPYSDERTILDVVISVESDWPVRYRTNCYCPVVPSWDEDVVFLVTV